MPFLDLSWWEILLYLIILGIIIYLIINAPEERERLKKRTKYKTELISEAGKTPSSEDAVYRNGQGGVKAVNSPISYRW